MRRLMACAVLLALAPAAPAQDVPVGRLFFTPAERTALEDARRRNIRAEALAAEADKRPQKPRARQVTVTGVVLRSDGESFAWVNGKSVEGETGDGLRIRHTAQPNRVLVYDPEKGRMVQVKVGQRADLVTGSVEENYVRRKREPLPEALPETDAGAPAASGASPTEGLQPVREAAPRTASGAEEDAPEEEGKAPPPEAAEERR
jgi:hypothetical protein